MRTFTLFFCLGWGSALLYQLLPQEWDEKAKKARKDYDRVMEEYRATLGGAPSK